jgi:LAS seventeen-binding protein 5
MVDIEVRKRCNTLFRQWAQAYKSTPGMERIVTLYKDLPQSKRPTQQQSKVLRETEINAQRQEGQTSTSPPSSQGRKSSISNTVPSSSRGAFSLSNKATPKEKSSQKKKAFNLEKEKPKMLEAIATASVASTNLLNTLKLINRENERISENEQAKGRFEQCKTLRRQILQYIQVVESEQYIGSLLGANDELVKALQTYEILDKSIDNDSDSETENNDNVSMPSSRERALSRSFDVLPPKNARPGTSPMPSPKFGGWGKERSRNDDTDSEEVEEDEPFDEDNPFGDQNAVKTPFAEPANITWYLAPPICASKDGRTR